MAMTGTQQPVREGRNRRVALSLMLVVAGMVGAAYAAVPLYDLFCRVTGYDGTTQVASDNPKGVIDRQMTVRFDSNIDGRLAWTVKAAKPVTGQIGSVETVTYVATNVSDEPVTGQAVFNVTPDSVGIYFNKIECFCFTEQTLKPGETVEMPVTFFVDPDIDANTELATIREITLSYTFYAQNAEGT